ncbi:hypothetical protein HKD37_01G001084 [Glycine soja]
MQPLRAQLTIQHLSPPSPPLLMQSYPARALDRKLQVDWARYAREGPRVLMSLRWRLLSLSLSPFRCHSSSKKQRNPLMKKILGLQAPMELASTTISTSLPIPTTHPCLDTYLGK